MQKMQKRMTVAIIVLLFAVIIGIFFYNTKFTYENFTSEDKSGSVLTYYYRPDCGFCKEFSPVWDADASDSKGLQYALNQAQLKTSLKKINVDDAENAKLAVEKKIQGVPTIIYTTTSGTDIEFNNDRTTANLVTFIKNN